jgi:ankyrin repeat protein
MGTCSSKEAASAGPVDEASILIKPDALADAAKLGDAAELRRLLEAGVDPDFHCGESKGTALHLAALNGHAECARALLEFGADADARDKARARGGTRAR